MSSVCKITQHIMWACVCVHMYTHVWTGAEGYSPKCSDVTVWVGDPDGTLLYAIRFFILFRLLASILYSLQIKEFGNTKNKNQMQISQSSVQKQVKLIMFISIKNWADMDSRRRRDSLLNLDRGLKSRPVGWNPSHGECFIWVYILNFECLWMYLST